MTRRRIVHATLAAFAAAGLVGAHDLTYAIAVPDAGVRAAMLSMSGHGYLSIAVVVATVAGIFGGFAAAAVGFRAGASMDCVVIGWRSAAWRIASIQTCAFLVLEFVERAAADVPVVTVNTRLLLIGVLVQIALAASAALVLSFVARVARVVGESATAVAPIPQLIRTFVAIVDLAAPRPAFAGGVHARSPPVASR